MQILDEEPPAGAAADLIALDSPFMSEPAAAPSIASALSGVVEPHFEATWAALGDGADYERRGHPAEHHLCDLD